MLIGTHVQWVRKGKPARGIVQALAASGAAVYVQEIYEGHLGSECGVLLADLTVVEEPPQLLTPVKHSSRRPAAPPLSQQLAGRARWAEEFANLVEDLGAPPPAQFTRTAWRVELERALAQRLWEAAGRADELAGQQVGLFRNRLADPGPVSES